MSVSTTRLRPVAVMLPSLRRGGRPFAAADRVTRRELARRLDVHQDTVSRVLPDGLADAVTGWGGRGKPMVFDWQRARRWALARACPDLARLGYRCVACRSVLEDCGTVGAHLLAVRHAAGGCPDCGCAWPVTMPCRWPLDEGDPPRRGRRAK
jgi:hypothetical protein